MNQSTAKLLKLYCMNIDEKGHLIPQNQKMQIFKDWKNLFTHQSKTEK